MSLPHATTPIPGNWSQPGILADFLTELLGVGNMGDVIGARTVLHSYPVIFYFSSHRFKQFQLTDVLRIRLFSHSGGYHVLSHLANYGGVPAVLEVTLLDSLYGDFDLFDAWVISHLASFGSRAYQFRFHSIYTDNGGTATNNQVLSPFYHDPKPLAGHGCSSRT